MVFDPEGSDSRERIINAKMLNKEDNYFSKQTALFLLVISDVLIVNAKVMDVSRGEGSGINLLEVIIEANMRIFGDEK